MCAWWWFCKKKEKKWCMHTHDLTTNGAHRDTLKSSFDDHPWLYMHCGLVWSALIYSGEKYIIPLKRIDIYWLFYQYVLKFISIFQQERRIIFWSTLLCTHHYWGYAFTHVLQPWLFTALLSTQRKKKSFNSILTIFFLLCAGRIIGGI